MKDTPRWALALSDNDLSITGIYKGFSCSLGANLTPTNAPRLTAMIGRATADLTTAYSTLKDLYGTKRPFQIEPAPVCLPSTAGLENSPDFVSGHATLGWAVGLIFAELAPDASTGVLMRGRAFAESRVVCGLHHVSAVEGGVATGTAVVAALHGSSAFRADMDRARKELAALRASSKEKPASCALESQALEKNPY
jgi:acid phosphatase (class A)